MSPSRTNPRSFALQPSEKGKTVSLLERSKCRWLTLSRSVQHGSSGEDEIRQPSKPNPSQWFQDTEFETPWRGCAARSTALFQPHPADQPI